MTQIYNNYLFFIILIIIGIIFYSNFNIKYIHNDIINIYKNPLFKIFFLLLLFTFGNYNIPFTLFLAVNYIGFGQLIQEKELMNNI